MNRDNPVDILLLEFLRDLGGDPNIDLKPGEKISEVKANLIMGLALGYKARAKAYLRHVEEHAKRNFEKDP